LVTRQSLLRREPQRRARDADFYLLYLMRRVDKQQARRLFAAVQKAVRAPGRSQHRIALTDRHPSAARPLATGQAINKRSSLRQLRFIVHGGGIPAISYSYQGLLDLLDG
jgi:hypothetical protein